MDMTVTEVMEYLAAAGNEGTKKVLMRHGARDPFFGVKVEELKKLQKRIKSDTELARQLFETGNSDAMYLAGLIADPRQLSVDDLNNWVHKAYWHMLSEYAVAQIAADSPFGHELGLRWINSDQEMVAAAGWATLAGYISVTDESRLDLPEIEALLDRVGRELHKAPNRVRYTMNGFIIAAGSYIPAMLDKARETAKRIGKVHVDMGGTACKVPDAIPYMEKIYNMGRAGKKRKTARC